MSEEAVSRRDRPHGLTASRRTVGGVLVAVLFLASGMSSGTCSVSSVPGAAVNDWFGAARPVILPDDHVLGDANAPVTIVEYESYQSTSSGRWARSEFPTIKQNYIDTGKVRWVFRQFPISSENRAKPAAYAAECADDQGQFLAYRDLVYQATDSSGATILTDAKLKEHADTLGLDRTTFDACLAGTGKVVRIDRDVNSGTALGVTVTPSFIVDAQLLSGFGTAEDMSKIIDRHLNGS